MRDAVTVPAGTKHSIEACSEDFEMLEARLRFAYKAPNNTDTLHIKHYIIRTLCI